MTVFRRLIASVGFYVVLDLAAAALLSRLSPGWNPAAVEASYRIPARYYHHGLV
ncbi:MAG: hypothetical protein H0T50_11390, partial [Gemmatimonadales bacterium]|nr:hypothetical protein [Gemmatimonadales bacterium]